MATRASPPRPKQLRPCSTKLASLPQCPSRALPSLSAPDRSRFPSAGPAMSVPRRGGYSRLPQSPVGPSPSPVLLDALHRVNAPPYRRSSQSQPRHLSLPLSRTVPNRCTEVDPHHFHPRPGDHRGDRGRGGCTRRRRNSRGRGARLHLALAMVSVHRVSLCFCFSIRRVFGIPDECWEDGLRPTCEVPSVVAAYLTPGKVCRPSKFRWRGSRTRGHGGRSSLRRRIALLPSHFAPHPMAAEAQSQSMLESSPSGQSRSDGYR